MSTQRTANKPRTRAEGQRSVKPVHEQSTVILPTQEFPRTRKSHWLSTPLRSPSEQALASRTPRPSK